jgi:hypothetical protein
VQTWKDCEPTVAGGYPVIGISIPGSKWCVDVALARTIASASRIGNVDESPSEAEIKQHGNSAQECDAAEAADKEESEDGVDDSGAGNTFNSANIGVDVQAMVVEGCEEVGEDSQNDSSAAEFDDAQEPGEAFESDAAAERHDNW